MSISSKVFSSSSEKSFFEASFDPSSVKIKELV